MRNKAVDLSTGEMEPPKEMIVVSDVRMKIETAKNVIEVLDVNSMAKAAEAFYAAQGMEENAQRAREVSLWAQRKAGEFLKEMPKNTGAAGIGPVLQFHDGTAMDKTPTLSDLDIDKHESFRWQLLAEIPEETFQDYIDSKIASGYELTAGGLVNIGKSLRKNEERKERLAVAPPAPVWIGDFETDCIYQADVTQAEFIQQLPENSVDLIVTDPPWDEGSLATYEAAAQIAARTLKPGHFMAIYSGKMFLPQIMNILLRELEYIWTFSVFQPDSNDKIQKYHLYSAWRPVILVKKPGPKIDMVWMPDSVKSTRDKQYHEWGQGTELVEKLIEGYSRPGEIVLDPFIGGASVPYIARLQKRRYIGFDIREETVRLGLARLEK